MLPGVEPGQGNECACSLEQRDAGIALLTLLHCVDVNQHGMLAVVSVLP